MASVYDFWQPPKTTYTPPEPVYRTVSPSRDSLLSDPRAKTGFPSYGGSLTGSSGSGSGDSWPSPDQLQQSTGYFDQLPDWNYYEPMEPQRKQEMAQEFADIHAAPQFRELERRLEQAIADATAQEARIRAAYAGTPEMLARREQEQSRQDLGSAIARGAGRSGVVDHLSGRRQEHFSDLLAAEEARKSAELAAVANQLGLVQRQVPDERAAIAEQAARLQSQELQRLRDLDYARGREYDVDQFARMLDVYDRTQLTPLQQLQLYIDMAETAGEFPSGVPTIM